MIDEIEALLPAPAKLGWLSDADIAEFSGGVVTRPWGINERTEKPERDGLFCSRIFGPVQDLRCLCGKYEGEAHRDTTCEKCGVDVVECSVRGHRFAHIELACPMEHPWSGLPITSIPVLPPDDRPMRSGSLTGLNAHYVTLIKRNDMMARCQEKKAPEILGQHERELLQAALAALFGTLPKRPARGEKLGSHLRRILADQVPADRLPPKLVRILMAVGLTTAA